MWAKIGRYIKEQGLFRQQHNGYLEIFKNWPQMKNTVK